jgi:hypothetical protein
MKKIKFYILFSEEKKRTFTSFENYCENDKKTFTLIESDSYKNQILKVRIFPSQKLAELEKESVLNQMEINNDYCKKSNINQEFSEEDFKLINNLKVVEMINNEVL